MLFIFRFILFNLALFFIWECWGLRNQINHPVPSQRLNWNDKSLARMLSEHYSETIFRRNACESLTDASVLSVKCSHVQLLQFKHSILILEDISVEYNCLLQSLFSKSSFTPKNRLWLKKITFFSEERQEILCFHVMGRYRLQPLMKICVTSISQPGQITTVLG